MDFVEIDDEEKVLRIFVSDICRITRFMDGTIRVDLSVEETGADGQVINRRIVHQIWPAAKWLQNVARACQLATDINQIPLASSRVMRLAN